MLSQMYDWLYRPIQFSLRNMFYISLSCLLQSFPSHSLKDLRLPVSGSAALTLYVWYVQTCQDSCVFFCFFPFLWKIIRPLPLPAQTSGCESDLWVKTCIFGQGDLFANNIQENRRFMLLMFIVKNFARFDMVRTGWGAWTSLVWCFFFGLKVKRLASSLWFSSTAIRPLIRVWLMHGERRILLICFLNEEITDKSVAFDTEATSGDVGAVKHSVNLNRCHYAILLKD